MFGVCSASAQPRITVGPSETTELLSVIMHLAGREGYNDPAVWPEYRALIDSIFAPYKEHPAVTMARRSSMSGDMPVLMAVHGRFENGKFLSPYDTPYLPLILKYFDWSEERHNDFLDAINDFYHETRFHDIYIEQLEPNYEQVKGLLEYRFNELIDLAWLGEYTGVGKQMSYFVTLSYLNAPNNYGYEVNGQPRPVMGVKNTGHVGIHFTMILLHEYLHPYINPICDSYSDMLSKSGEILFPPISGIVGYPDWDSVQYEALINASVVAYMRQNDLLKEYAENEIAINRTEGFWWVGELADLLEEYQNQRDKYPTLESFMPRIVKFYDDLAAEAARKQAE